MNENAKHFALSLAAVYVAAHLFHDGRPIEATCSKDSPQLPACGAQDEAPSAPPLASVTIPVSSTATVIVGGTFIDTLSDEEHAVPPKPHPGIAKVAS